MRLIVLVLALLVSSLSHASERSTVAVILADGRKVDLSPSLLADLPNQAVVGTSHGTDAEYSGYDLREVLRAAGVAPVEGLRGKQLAEYLTVTAADGYQVVFGMAELDPILGNTLVLLTNSENGQPLTDSHGPWRLVVPGDQRAARWVRQVTSVRVSRQPAAGAEAYCDTGQPHPIDIEFAREIGESGGVTVEMRNAQGKAYEGWDKELNREYRELMAQLSTEEQASLREAQRAWLSFREAEAKFWWSESISGGGTSQPLIVSDYGTELLKGRVCQLLNYKRFATP